MITAKPRRCASFPKRRSIHKNDLEPKVGHANAAAKAIAVKPISMSITEKLLSVDEKMAIDISLSGT